MLKQITQKFLTVLLLKFIPFSKSFTDSFKSSSLIFPRSSNPRDSTRKFPIDSSRNSSRNFVWNSFRNYSRSSSSDLKDSCWCFISICFYLLGILHRIISGFPPGITQFLHGVVSEIPRVSHRFLTEFNQEVFQRFRPELFQKFPHNSSRIANRNYFRCFSRKSSLDSYRKPSVNFSRNSPKHVSRNS